MSAAHHGHQRHDTGLQLGGAAFNHGPSSSAETEYDRLRSLAREEQGKKNSCGDRAHRAYEQGNGELAHQLSEERQQHETAMENYNRQASEFIFRENNAVGRVAEDTIDLHGQYVEEAERILETRIRAAKAQGQNHLHVIVGKGNHSPHHIQKIKPMVERLCQEEGLQYHTEPNEGRLYVNLGGGGGGQMPPPGPGGQHQYHSQQQPHYGGGKPQHQFQHGNNDDEMQQIEKALLRKCIRSCCTVM